ncbi:hypothetical protein AUC61_18495 [Pseudomonas sp. S25]|uniref:Big-1 domain-containing protein n=2 Tax=Pseudomonas maioricensis TaxID=1766623 RepID=A0ABS9ZML4_9PSED|nr:hypothetical protein [Pseudomonas sp. S25]
MASKKGKAVKPLSAMDVLLSSTGQHRNAPLTLSEQYPTVLSVARSDVVGLLNNNPGLHITEARELVQRARAMSVVIARQFREQRLTASVRHANRPPTGVKGLVEGPTYTDMFNPDWANQCPPDAIEATTSPVAYLADLYRYSQELEATGKPADVITLDARRPDLKNLVLDHTALNRIEPTIVLVNEILDSSIRKHLNDHNLKDTTVDDALLEARYPNALPFERYTSQINYVLERKGHSLGDVIRLADPAYPYFKEPGAHSVLSDVALIQDTGFGPAQQSLLLEAPYFPDAATRTRSLVAGKWRIEPRTRLLVEATEDEHQFSTFFEDNFGVGGLIDLQDTQTFCLRTGLNTEELEALLSVGAFAPSRSVNVTAAAEAATVDGSQAGSVYINAGKAPAMAIETLPGESVDGVLVEGPRHHIVNASPDRFDRMNRMIRLARWLDLPFDEVDQIIVACMRAEVQSAAVFPVITANTLRAIGLFQTLRRKYKLPAEDFAALIQGIGVYGRGKEASHFDRVFNSQALFSEPLKLHNTPMVVAPATEAQRQKVDHLCASLGMTYESFRYLARIVVQSRGDPEDHPLLWSVEVVSTFYRLTKLPRYMGVTTIEALALIEILDSRASQLTSKVAGRVRIETHAASTETDTLSVLHAWVDCVAWMQETGWQVAQLYPLLGARFTDIVASEAELGLLDQINQRLQAALITDSSFAEIGAPVSEVLSVLDGDGQERQVLQAIDWFEKLEAFIDTVDGTRGLIRHLGDNEPSFENYLISRVKEVVSDLKPNDDALADKIINRVMRARAEQGALLMEGLAGYLNVSADQADALLAWAQGNRYELLKEVCRIGGGGNTIKVAIGDDILWLLVQLSQRATITRHLHMSSALIRQFLGQPDWFGLPDTSLSFQAVYTLTQYATVVQRSEQSEDTLLDYIRLVNTHTGESPGDKRLIRESAAQRLGAYLRWGIREVLAVAMYLDSDSGVSRTVSSINVISRLALMGHQASLDAKSLLALAMLQPISRVAEYRDAAEQALSTINNLMSQVPESEVGQSRAHTITVSRDYLVANKPDGQAVFTLTLRSLTDEPLADITLDWETSLGQLSGGGNSDEQGIATVTLDAGNAMGIATVQVHFGLGETQKAPAVTIGYDKVTMNFVSRPGEREPDSALANRLEPIFFRNELQDDYGNWGIDYPVTWGTTLGEFRRHITLGDSNGKVEAELRSLSPSEGPEVAVVAVCENGNACQFVGVEFTDDPYFQYIRFADAVTVGYEVRVECRVVRIDGSPIEPETLVGWATDNGEFEVSTSKTDEDGVAFALLTPATVGNVIVTVSSIDVKTDKQSESTPVYPVTTLALTVSDETYLVGTAPLVFTSELKVGAEPAVKRGVNWYVDRERKPDSYTNARGMAIFSSKFAVGNHVVSAIVAGTAVEDSVSVQAVNCRFEGAVTGYLLPEQAAGLLSRYESYTLTIKAFEEDNDVPLEGIPFIVRAKGAAELAMSVARLGEPQLSLAGGVIFPVTFDPVALTGSVTLEVECGGVVMWRGVFKVGYYYKLGVVNFGVRPFASLSPLTKVKDIKPIPNVLKGGAINARISIPLESWYKEVFFRNPLAAPENITAEIVGGSTPSHGAIATVESQFLLGGYFYLIASGADVYVP